jgi:hypothetical protein
MTAGTDNGSSSTDDITNDTTPNFAITCNNNSTVSMYDGVTFIVSGTCSGGSITLTSTALTDGSHSMNAGQVDIAGNVSSLSASLSITIDTSTPSAPGTAPDLSAGSDTGTSNTDNITNDNTVTFTGTCTNGETITIYDGTPPGVSVGSVVCAGGVYSVTTGALADGSHTFYITTTDVAGNESTPSPTVVTITILGLVVEVA